MARMRRGLVHAMAWSLATGAAVTLSWWGVHTVLAGTVYDPPRALPIPAGGGEGTAVNGGDPSASAAPRPSGSATPSPTPSASRTTGAPPRTPSATPSRPPATTRQPDGAGDAGDAGGKSTVKSYAVDGGRVVFDLGETSAELVSATPASGWQMQVWKQPTWIRVTFTRDGRELSVFCVWHDTAPRVEIDER
ncbi:hypothetical protein ACF06X_00945 [Streptomyces sp. NPDC015346]|uniref:hypothetical protein n=1 Tax=Streptomyces sp. NPDC015346 TaxID=3364954 RepID=UPI0036F97197